METRPNIFAKQEEELQKKIAQLEAEAKQEIDNIQKNLSNSLQQDDEVTSEEILTENEIDTTKKTLSEELISGINENLARDIEDLKKELAVVIAKKAFHASQYTSREQAKDYYLKAIQYDPTNSNYLQNYANLSFELRKNEKIAVEDFEDLGEQADLQKLIPIFDTAIHLAPNAVFYYYRGLAQQNKNNIAECIYDFYKTYELASPDQTITNEVAVTIVLKTEAEKKLADIFNSHAQKEGLLFKTLKSSNLSDAIIALSDEKKSSLLTAMNDKKNILYKYFTRDEKNKIAGKTKPENKPGLFSYSNTKEKEVKQKKEELQKEHDKKFKL